MGIREGVLGITAEVIWRSEAAGKPSYGAVKMLTMLRGSRALSPSLPAEGVIGHGGRSRAALYCVCGQRGEAARQRCAAATLAASATAETAIASQDYAGGSGEINRAARREHARTYRCVERCL